jgi:iron complex outermembrane receptor protein
MVLGLGLCPFTTMAQVTALEPVTVSAPAEARMFGEVRPAASDLQQQRAATSDAAHLLRQVPSLSLYGAGGLSSLPTLRGLADDRLRIRLDGMDLISSCPNHMNPPLSYVDAAAAGSFKVYAGITPVSLGGDSLGGTIEAETARPRFASGTGSVFQGTAGTRWASNGDARGINLSVTQATSTLSVNYTGSAAEAGNATAAQAFNLGTATGRPGHSLPLDEIGSSAYRSRNHQLGLAYQQSGDLFEARLGYQDIPYQLYPNQRMDMLGNEQTRLNLHWRGERGWGTVDARVWHEAVDHFMNFGADKQFQYGTAPGMPMYTASENSGVTLKAEWPVGTDTRWRAGLDWQRYRLDDWWPASGTAGAMQPDTHININDGQRDRLAVHAEAETRHNATWTSLLGARIERVDMDAGRVDSYSVAATPEETAFNARSRRKTDHNLDLSLLARYRADQVFDVEFGFARKLRSPNLHQRYTWRTRAMEMVMNTLVGDGNGYVGDVDLKPEKAHTLSATLDWHAPGRDWEFKATPYITVVDDYIDAVRCTTANTVAGSGCPAVNAATNQFVQLKYANHDARLHGLDLSGRMPLGRSSLGDFGLQAVASYTRGKNRSTGDGLYNIMPPNGTLSLTHRHGGWDNALEINAVARKERLSAVRNEVVTGGYGLVNLRASHSWKQVRLDAGIENLLDKSYAHPLGGAYVGQGSTMMINGIPWGVTVPGTGRSLYFGLSMSF